MPSQTCLQTSGYGLSSLRSHKLLLGCTRPRHLHKPLRYWPRVFLRCKLFYCNHPRMLKHGKYWPPHWQRKAAPWPHCAPKERRNWHAWTLVLPSTDSGLLKMLPEKCRLKWAITLRLLLSIRACGLLKVFCVNNFRTADALSIAACKTARHCGFRRF